MAKRYLNLEAARSGGGHTDDEDSSGGTDSGRHGSDDWMVDDNLASQDSAPTESKRPPPAELTDRAPRWAQGVVARHEHLHRIIEADAAAQETAQHANRADRRAVNAMAQPLGPTADGDDEQLSEHEFMVPATPEAEPEAEQREQDEEDGLFEYRPVEASAPAPVYPPAPVADQRQLQQQARPQQQQAPARSREPHHSQRSIGSQSLGRARSPGGGSVVAQPQPAAADELRFPLPFPDLSGQLDLSAAPCVDPTTDRVERYTLVQLVAIIDEWLSVVQGAADTAWVNPEQHSRNVRARFYSSDPLPNTETVFQYRRAYAAWVTYIAVFLRRASIEETGHAPDAVVVRRLEQVAVLMAALADVSARCCLRLVALSCCVAA
jgi:hypothetical protein